MLCPDYEHTNDKIMHHEFWLEDKNRYVSFHGIDTPTKWSNCRYICTAIFDEKNIKLTLEIDLFAWMNDLATQW